MEENRDKQYNEIVGSIINNVLAERQRCGKIILWDFQPDNDMDRLYFNVAAIVANMNREPMYLDMSLWKFLKMRIKRKKAGRNLYYLTKSTKKEIPVENKTSIYILMDFIREYHGISEETFKKINDEFYGWVE